MHLRSVNSATCIPIVVVVSLRRLESRVLVCLRRGSRTERGFVHTVQFGANCPPGTECQARMRQTQHNSGMTPGNWKAGTGERTRELPGGNARSYSPVGFRHHWFERQISWCLPQGAEPMENGPPCGLPPFASRDRSVFPGLYAHAPASLSRSRTAGAQRLSERGSGKENIPWHWSTDALRPLTTKQQENSAEQG